MHSRTEIPSERMDGHMKAMTRLVIGGLLVLVPMLTGCSTNETIDDLRATNRSLNERVVQLEQEIEGQNRALELLKGRAEQAETYAGSATASRDSAISNLESLRGDYEKMLQRINDLNMTLLPADLNAALEELAAQNPDIMTYDPVRGMIRMSSDLTFDSGSDQLKGAAVASLKRLAEVIKSSSAEGFEVRVVGHTDNVQVSNPATRAKHPNNMFLSAHRAISVRAELVKDGVAANRVSVGGWGEFRPVAPNVKGGTRENRRVEIFIVPMAGADVPMTASGAAESGQQTRTAPSGLGDEPLK